MLCFGLLIMWCSTNTPAPVGSTFCQIAKPIYWHASDTRRTKEAIDLHNARGKQVCGWGRK